MRILVTGSAGFIGTAVVGELLSRGHHVVAVDCLLPNLYSAELKYTNSQKFFQNPSYEFHPLDLRSNMNEISKYIFECDIVVNFAAMPGLLKSWSEIDTYLSCNVSALSGILDAIIGRNIAIIHASTSSVYGEIATGNEQSDCNPVSPYGVSKLAAENLVTAHYKNFRTNYSILRFFSVYGPNQRPDMAYSKFCDALLNNEPLPITGSMLASRSNTYIDDVARTVANAVEYGVKNKTYNICGDQEIVLRDAINILASEIGVTPIISQMSGRPGDQLRTKGENALAKQELGLQDSVTPEEGLRKQAQAAIRNLQN